MDTKALKVGITSSVISSLVVIIFINPIMRLVWRIVIFIARTLHHGYVDAIYRRAASPEAEPIGFATFLGVFALATFVASLTTFAGDEDHISMLRRTRGAQRLVLYFVRFCTASMMAMLLVIFSIGSGMETINASFTQRLTILAPVISDGEYKSIKARWASMSGKDDYDRIVSDMDKRAKELGTTLPPQREP
jgi:hypothetical protein